MIKRLESKDKKLKKEKRNQLILAAVLVLVMFGSVFGIVFSYNSGNTSSSNSSVLFNGYNFNIENGFYTITLGASKFYFSSNPNDVNNLPKDVNLSRTLSNYSKQDVYVSSIDYPSYSEIVQVFNPYVTRIQGACKLGEVCSDYTLPIKTCDDNLIVIKVSTQNKIYEDKNCVYIEGKKSDLLKLTDEFLLRELGLK